MEIQIKSDHIPTIKALFDGERPDGLNVRLVQPVLYCDSSEVDWFTFAVTLAASVPTGVFINWLSEKLLMDNKKTKLFINRKEIYFDNKGDITRIIEETSTLST